MVALEMSNMTGWIQYFNEVQSTNLTSYNHLLIVTSPTMIVQATTTFLAFDSNVINFLSLGYYGTSCKI
jgi:hypothetical protein